MQCLLLCSPACPSCCLSAVSQVKDKQNDDTGQSAGGVACCARRDRIRDADSWLHNAGLEEAFDDIFEHALRKAARDFEHDTLYTFMRTLLPCLKFMQNCT